MEVAAASINNTVFFHHIFSSSITALTSNNLPDKNEIKSAQRIE